MPGSPDLDITTDVLIIGGGMAGAWAATAAARAGVSVVLVDKGYCGTSGVTASAGPGHWWAPPDPPEARRNAIRSREAIAFGLGDPDWMERIIDQTFRLLPTLGRHYRFPADDRGIVNYRAVRGPEYMRALRAQLVDLGVTVLDHHPALELLVRPDGSVGGAGGIRRQYCNSNWRIAAGATVLAAGGTSFLSHLLGSRTNTGDGYLMAAEVGASLSGMEFTSAYTVAPKHSTMTRTMAYSFATYFDSDGREIDAPFGPDQTHRLARALLEGPVFCSLARLPEDVRDRLHTISPNVPLVFDRFGIDPYHDRFEVTLHTDGTIRGIGGVRIADADCSAGVPGLYVAGDNASRELVAGASSGGGNVNSAWALSSGTWAGQAAARDSRLQRTKSGPLVGAGWAGMIPRASSRAIDLTAVIRVVKSAMHPYDRNLFRSAAKLSQSAEALADAWRETADHGRAASASLAHREAAALVATARWSVQAALARRETRGMHVREDYFGRDPDLAHRLVVAGFDRIVITADGAAPRIPHQLDLAS